MQHKTIITPNQKEFLSAFFSTYLKDYFFLTGGTALSAYYLHHRLSEDLDLFTINQDIQFDSVNAEINKITKSLHLRIERQVSSPTFLQFILTKKGKKPLKIDVVKDVPIHFGIIKKVENIRIDSLENIVVGKILAVFGRADAKDFIDLYFLFGKKGLSFQKFFALAKKKDLGLNEFYLSEMLSRASIIKEFPKTIKPFKKNELIKFFLELSDALFKKIKPKK